MEVDTNNDDTNDDTLASSDENINFDNKEEELMYKCEKYNDKADEEVEQEEKEYDDICTLLKKLNIEEAPTSYYQIKQVLITDDEPKVTIKTVYICESCSKETKSLNHCDNKNCDYHQQAKIHPCIFNYFNIKDQLSTILRTEKNI
ncbi:unnamed protein product [Didymodactylos carnosus]|uniref:Uncharacterized protein n=1 Tax=Didymodactylos carnosus TaxID=1234261 RepID=A0A814DIL6_9BILA|nr:unnamed protein product [Didymodactylos carnosus]CAF0955951.1 unnamed protein product [Didymodactylos carnosus]CAF3723207.1 unnamed protein product [Didymodactylos carnosus]CAF3731019.1 unnamed protein product [Didymodactylos carnosus]